MAKRERIYAALTGDLRGSSRLKGERRRLLLNNVKTLFERTRLIWSEEVVSAFAIFRGDAFQTVLADPSVALKIAVYLRAGMRTGFSLGAGLYTYDAQMAIGVGTIDGLREPINEADGEALSRSGRLLDRMGKHAMLSIETGVEDVDDEINTELALLDRIIGRWSPGQACAVMDRLAGMSQKDIAGKLSLTEGAISQRLHSRVSGK